MCNERPHYQHNTMYGGIAHLFHVLDSHYHVPRWVIGPHPGNENGWAFCESDARFPHEIANEWISWDGMSWHSTATLRFTPPAEGADDEVESDYEEEAQLESMYVGQDGEANGGERPQQQPPPPGGEGGGSSSNAGAPVAAASDAETRAPRFASGRVAPQQAEQRRGGATVSSRTNRAGAKSSLCIVM